MTIKIILLSLLLFAFACSNAQEKIPINVNLTENIFNSFIELHPDSIAYPTVAKSYKWNYEQGLILEAFYRMWKATNDIKYYNYLKKNIDYYIGEEGTIKTYNLSDYNLDNIAPGRQLLHLYKETGEKKYREAAGLLIRQLQEQPRTSEGGFWHKKRYPYQMWLDGLYMAEPFYLEYALMFKEEKYIDDVAKQFKLIKKHLKDENTGLYYHGWDESKKQRWSDPETGRSPSFWGRSIGWFMMGMIDVLDSFPQDDPDREIIQSMFISLAESLLDYKDGETKLWYQVVDQGSRDGNYIETSSSLMFIYCFAKGVNKGYLPKDYFQAATESFNSLLNRFVKVDENDHFYLQNTVSVGGLGGKPYRDGSFEYYLSEPIRVNDFKGYGPLLLAAIELKKNSTRSQ